MGERQRIIGRIENHIAILPYIEIVGISKYKKQGEIR